MYLQDSAILLFHMLLPLLISHHSTRLLSSIRVSSTKPPRCIWYWKFFFDFSIVFLVLFVVVAFLFQLGAHISGNLGPSAASIVPAYLSRVELSDGRQVDGYNLSLSLSLALLEVTL
jgi:hypothetical protein